MSQVMLALALGVLFAVGTFLTLRRDVVRVVWGVAIVSQSANVYLVTMGGFDGGAPILGGHGAPEPGTVTDPLVQALVLTAIVIGFGTTALALVLTYRMYEEHGTIDLRDVAANDVHRTGTGALPDGGTDDAPATGGGQSGGPGSESDDEGSSGRPGSEGADDGSSKRPDSGGAAGDAGGDDR